MTGPARFHHGLPTDAGLQRIRLRLLVLVGVAVVAAVVMTAVGDRSSTALVVAGFVLVLGTGLTVGDAAPGSLAKREVLTAGSRGRRRRLRWALLRGRTDLPDDDLRILHHLVPVVRARSRVLLSLGSATYLGGCLMLAGFVAGAESVPGWFVPVMIPVVVVLALAELILRAVEARAAARYLARPGA